MMCDKPTVCQVDGCNGTSEVYRHKETGLYACKKCRSRYRYNKSFEYRKTHKEDLQQCEVPGCKRKRNVTYFSEKGMYVCTAHKYRWNTHGSFAPPPLSKEDKPKPQNCQVDGCERLNAICWHKATGIYACNACRSYYSQHGTFVRKLQTAVKRPDECEMPDCHNTHHIAFHAATQSFCCLRCRRKYRAETRMEKWQKHLVLHDYTTVNCECGKPATRKVKMSTGGLHVYTGNRFVDVVLPVSQRYYISLCDECAAIEETLHQIDGNDYRPTGYIRREAAD